MEQGICINEKAMTVNGKTMGREPCKGKKVMPDREVIWTVRCKPMKTRSRLHRAVRQPV